MKKKILLIHTGGTKLMFLMGQYERPELIQSHFQKSLTGEMTVLQ